MKNSLSEKRLLPYIAVFSVLLALLVLLLIPLFLLAGFAVPAADDFSFSCETHAAYQSGRGILAMIAAAAGKTAEVYESWQGTFSAVFLMAFQPSVWGFRFYGLTTWIMLISLVSGIFLICFRVFSGVFGAAKSLSGIIAAVIAAACTQFLPSPNQGFFWYNGSVYYTFTFGLVLWFFSILIAWLQRGESWRVALLSLLGIVIGGNNYVTALLTVILMSVILLGLLICKSKNAKGLLIPFVFLLAAFAVSASAPGNAVRQSAFAEHPGPIRAILLSFRYALHGIRRWSDLRLLACLLLLAPFLWNAASGSSREHTFRLPGAVTAFSFCLLASMFTPHVYAIGFDGPGRLQNIYFYAYVLLLVFNLFWWCGWVGRRISKNADALLSSIRVLPFLFFSASAVLCMACSLFLFRGSLTSAAALGELRSGEAQAYYAQALERQAILEDPAVQDCVFTPFRENPWLLYFGDMTDDPHSYENEDTATFYGKHSIIVKNT